MKYIQKNLEEAIRNGTFQATFPEGQLKNVLLGERLSNHEHQQTMQQPTMQQPTMHHQPEPVQQPVQDNNTSFVSYQDLHSQQYLGKSTEPLQE